MNRVAWWTCALIALIDAHIYDRCELARELTALGVDPDNIATWVCIAYHESRFDTAARNPSSGDHGLFQISELYWCGPGKACGLPCSALRDEDISDDLECALQVHEEHTRFQGDGFLAWVVYAQHCKHNTKKYLADCDTSVKNYVPSKPRTYKYDDMYYSNITTVKKQTVEDLLPPYLVVSSIFKGNYGRVFNKSKGRIDWINYKIDNIDDLKLPVFDKSSVPVTTTTTTTTTPTTTSTYIPPVKPWRTIETNQFRKKQRFDEKITTKKYYISTIESTTSSTTSTTKQPPSTTSTTKQLPSTASTTKLSPTTPSATKHPLSTTTTTKQSSTTTTTWKPFFASTIVPQSRVTTINNRVTSKPSTITTTTQRPIWTSRPVTYRTTTIKPSTTKSKEKQYYFTTTTVKPLVVTTSTPTTSKAQITFPSRTTTKTTTYKPFTWSYGTSTTTRKPNFSWYTFTSRTTTPAPAKFTQSFTQSTTRPAVSITTTSKPIVTTRKPEATTQKPKTTQSIFDLYLNPTKPPQLPSFKFSAESDRIFKLKIFSGGTTTAPPSKPKVNTRDQGR